jgi:hypothetical protein
MKNRLLASLALTFLSALIPQLSIVFAQGSLTPPGAPAPTMKSLAQIEPRTPITAVPFTISEPGSYYLTTNVTTTVSNAIVIVANGVTLDLNGFTISSTVASAANGGTAILLAGGLSDISILNGHIRGGVTNNGGVYSGSGFASGISDFPYRSLNVLVSRISFSGCLYNGVELNAGGSPVVEFCTARTVGNYGLSACTVKGSTAMDCGSTAVYGVNVSDCRGESTGVDPGIIGSTVQNCYSSSSSGVGISATTAQNCYGFSSSGIGLSAFTALNCYGTSSSNAGLSANTAQNCYGTSSSNAGLSANTAQNCYGTSSSYVGLYVQDAQNCQGYSSSGGPGISAETASNCYGQGLIRGISANVAISCSGRSFGGSYGVFATSIANTCYGISATGTGLGTTIAIGCIGVNNSGPSVLASYKYNMPP